jgi:hypothetical protein
MPSILTSNVFHFEQLLFGELANRSEFVASFLGHSLAAFGTLVPSHVDRFTAFGIETSTSVHEIGLNGIGALWAHAVKVVGLAELLPTIVRVVHYIDVGNENLEQETIKNRIISFFKSFPNSFLVM